MRLADHSVSLKALPVNALIGLEQTTRFTGGHDYNSNTTGYARGSEKLIAMSKKSYLHLIK